MKDKIIEHRISIDWENETGGDGPNVYCDGASSWKACGKPEDLESAIDLCIEEKMAAKAEQRSMITLHDLTG